MKQTFTKFLGCALCALFLLMPSSAKAVTLADWQFSTLYEESSHSGTTYYYTPNTSGVCAGIGHYWYSERVPVFYPQTYINGTQTDYQMTAASPGRYWQVGQSGTTFLNESSVANDITDWNDASSHKVYVELSFPTTGYKDIQLQFGYRSYNGVAGVTIVVSPDGGTTWLKGNDLTAVSSLTDEVVSLGVANKANVKVRILCENGKSGYSYFSYFTVTGNALGGTSLYSGSVDVDDDNHGSALISPAGGTYEDASSVTVTATPKTGWAFKEWQKGGVKVSEDNPYIFSISENTALTAIFKSNTTYTLTTSKNQRQAGSISCSPDQTVIDDGTEVTLTATPENGYAFVEWQDGVGSTVSTSNPYVFNIGANTELTAVFASTPVAAGESVKILKWTFNDPYNKLGNVYTPKDGDFAQENLSTSSEIRPDFYINQANSTACMKENWTSSGGQYQIRKNYAAEDQRCLALINASNSNDISNYTDAAQHDGYFEANFSTIGYNNVGISFVAYRNANGGAGNSPAMHVAYSADNGTTWIDAGETAISTNWWVGTTVTPTVSIDNASNVKIRIFPKNGHEGYWYVDDFTVTGKIATTTVDVTSALYATYYNSIPVELPANLQAATIDGETSGTLTLNWRYAEGDVIPGGTPVLLKATAADTYTLTYVANDATAAPAGNLLHGSDVATTTTGGDKYYALQYGTGANASVLGFYYINAGGAAFTSGAHKAWLALPAASREFFEIDGDVTAIKNIKVGTEDNVYYDLQGRRVFYPTKGLYIVNGKKVVLK